MNLNTPINTALIQDPKCSNEDNLTNWFVNSKSTNTKNTMNSVLQKMKTELRPNRAENQLGNPKCSTYNQNLIGTRGMNIMHSSNFEKKLTEN